MCEFSTIAPNVLLYAGSDDYLSGISTPIVSLKYKDDVKIVRIILNKHCIIGSSSVVLPDVNFQQGDFLGVLSLTNKKCILINFICRSSF